MFEEVAGSKKKSGPVILEVVVQQVDCEASPGKLELQLFPALGRELMFAACDCSGGTGGTETDCANGEKQAQALFEARGWWGFEEQFDNSRAPWRNGAVWLQTTGSVTEKTLKVCKSADSLPWDFLFPIFLTACGLLADPDDERACERVFVAYTAEDGLFFVRGAADATEPPTELAAD